jgi:hypothetical protein
MLVAACSGGGGSSSGDSTAIGAPTGISGSSASAHGSKSASKSATRSGSHTPSHGASTTSGAASSSTHHSSGGGGSHSSSPAAQHSSTKPVDNGCRSSAPPAPSDPSKASITVCPAIGLHSGDTVTITGHSFKANESLIVTECHYLGESADNYALSQCNIGNILNFKPSKTTKSDASGNVGPVTLVVAEQFKRIDCSSEPCLISVAVPIQNSAADNPHVIIKFG